MRSLVLDVRFRVDGRTVRVKRATGSDSKGTLRAMAEMVRLLWRQPAHRYIVEDLAHRRRNLIDVYVAYVTGAIEGLTATGQDRPVADVLDTWLPALQVSAGHRLRYRQSFARLLRGARGTPRVSELPFLLEQYRGRCVAAGTPRAFNYAKQGCQALMRDEFGRRHPLWGAIADVARMPEAKLGVSPLTVAEAVAVRDRLPEHAAAIWWAMCCTGMGSTEFWGEWSVLADRVRIVGTKRPGRRWGSMGREVPLVFAFDRPSILPHQFAKLLRRAGAAPYQGRKSFATWLEDAEIPRTRRRLYLGHGAKDVTDLYERRDVTAFLAEDRDKLLRVMGQVPRFAGQKTGSIDEPDAAACVTLSA